MLALVLAATLSATPSFIEPWGFALEAKGDVIVVAAVRAGSPAETAKLAAGAEVLRLAWPRPTRKNALGLLDAEQLDDVVAEVAASKDERLVLEVAGDRYNRYRVMERTPFTPKTTEELRKLTPVETSRYYMEMQRKMMPPRFSSGGPRVGFDDRADATAYVEPQKHVLQGVVTGGATGSWVWARRRVSWSCPNSTGQSLTVKGSGLGEAVTVDVRFHKLHGASDEVLLPVAKLRDVEACPAQPIVRRLDFELKCEKGEPVVGRERLRLFVKCGKPDDMVYVPPVFSRVEPIVLDQTVTEGAARVQVRPWLERGGPIPTKVDVLVLDAAGKRITGLPAAWRGDGLDTTDTWENVHVEAPAAPGSYSVVFDATWPDGSRSRSAGTPLTVLSKAERAQRDDSARSSMSAFSALSDRIEAEHVNLCDRERAIAWLRKQPELAEVFEQPGGDYSYLVKGFPSAVVVHCHHK